MVWLSEDEVFESGRCGACNHAAFRSKTSGVWFHIDPRGCPRAHERPYQSYGGSVAAKPKRLLRYTKSDRDTILAKYRKLQRLHRVTRGDLKMREYEMGSLNLWLGALLAAIRDVRATFRDLDSSLFETDEGDIRQRELSKYEKTVLNALYAAMNEPANSETKAQSETSSVNPPATAHKAGREC